MTMYFHFFICYAFQVTEKFFELTGIRHNITSAYHPQVNGEVERFNRTTQEAFLKTQEFSDKVKEADVDWHKKLNSILFTYRLRKQASTCIISFFMMYGREPILPWEVEHDLGPLESDEVPELCIDEVIQRMYDLQVQVLDGAAANIKQAQKVQARAYNAKHARNAFAVGEKVWRMNPLWSAKLKALRKGPKWVGGIVERKGGGNGNYVLKCLSDKNKGKINKSSYPPNHLKRYVIRNPDIPNGNTSESEYALTMKMKHRRLLKALVMLPVRFLFTHQWTLMTILCQILQWTNLLCHHMFVHHLCLLCCCMLIHHLMNLLHHCMFIHHLCFLSCSMFIHHPSCFLVIHQAV